MMPISDPDKGVLSDRVKAAIKTALAMVLAYGVALSMNWGNADWAAFSVAFCTLSAVGESLNKGLLRLCGTFLAIVATITLIALFPQDRWLFLIGMSIVTGFCTYMMAGTSRWYFWNVAGLSVPLLALAGGSNPLNDFQTVVTRFEETALGVMSYSLVWLLIWPISSRGALENAVRRLVAAQRQLAAYYLTPTIGEMRDANPEALKQQATQVLAHLSSLLDGAEVDSYEVWEARLAWRGLIRQLLQLSSTFERLRQSSTKEFNRELPMPGLPKFAAELDRRFSEIGRMLEGYPPERGPTSVPLNVEERLGSLSPFHRAALLLYGSHLQEIDKLTRDLFETVADIRNFTRAKVNPAYESMSLLSSALDPERLASVARWFTGLWLAWFIALYVPDIPDTVEFIVLVNSLSMALCMTPQAPIVRVFLPVAFGIALGGAIYVLVMPHLTTFASLGVVIFATVFLICYLFHRPIQAAGKAAALGLLVLVMGVNNEQNYNFLNVANLAVVLPLVFAVLAVATHFPVSFRAEHVFLRLLSRFFGACACLVSTLSWNPAEPPTLWQRLRRELHLGDLKRVPGQLAIWASALPAAALGRSSTNQVLALVDSLQALSYRMQDLIEIRATPQSQVLARELLSEVRKWRLGLQDIFGNLSQRPEAADFADFRARLDAMLEQLEGQIEEAVAVADKAGTSTTENENSVRLLGAFRGVSEALVNFARQAGGIDWACLREARF
ncbi:FUSC family protein [Bradyrhizobium sp. Ec3.3]|uniref:FUSC family protein n=1 Tax=Bradyrhizobium sp. Ec3.3 TaxID=189753 RepID=UPI0012EC0A1F|nr:FUSC family protein [Bradyrhizobium sp. Ec3.3]